MRAQILIAVALALVVAVSAGAGYVAGTHKSEVVNVIKLSPVPCGAGCTVPKKARFFSGVL